MSALRAGFVGLGAIGLPMAARVAAAGYPLAVHDRDRAVRERVPEGASWADGPAQAARDADVLLLSLPDGDVVREVVLGPGGAAEALAPGAVVVDLSSSAPTGTVALGEALAARGIALLDAPVSGGVVRARTGELAMMVGGPAEVLERVRPLLEAIAVRIYSTGRLGSGHALKALNNYVSAAGLLAALEALDVAGRFGIDEEVALAVINASTGRNNSTETKIAQHVLSGTHGAGFGLRLMAKDVRTAGALAAELGAPSRLLEACSALWDEAADGAAPAADHTEVGGALGLEVGPRAREDRSA